MTYILKHGETLQDALHRISVEEIDFAEHKLSSNGTDPKTIHQVRKAIKRTRALLRLARPLMTAKQFKRENALLRTAAQNLSGSRDADVMLPLSDLPRLLRETGELFRVVNGFEGE